MILEWYLRGISAGACLATAILIAGRDGWLTDEQFHAAYVPAVWACYRLPLFVIEHERWIEVFAAVRLVWQAFRPDTCTD